MIYLWASLLCVLNLFWLFLVILGLPGTWLMVLSTVGLAWWQWDPARGWNDQMFSGPVLIAVVALALAGEVVEFMAGMAGAKRAGGTVRGSIGALVGALAGGIAATFVIPIPVIGSLLGACLGAAAGAWLLELSGGRHMQSAVDIGVGAGVGRFKGTIAKLGVAVLLWLTISVAAFWP